MENAKIFVCTHKSFTPPTDPFYVPLFVGKKGKEDLGYIGDDTGDECSAKNCYYGELTGLYWVARNCPELTIKGTCHYRRFLLNDDGKVFSKEQVEELLGHYDLITTKTLSLRSNYYDGFGANHNCADLDLTEKVIKEKYPEYYETYNRLVHDNKTYFGNMIICRAPLFDAYVNWLFSIFEEMEPLIDFESYDAYHRRVFGFISEFLLKVYVEVNHLSVYECMVGMVGEKKETIQVREQLAQYIERAEYARAREYFAGVQRERPDILMEASDVNGELKLAMQMIATLEREEHSQTVHSYEQLRQLFLYMNRLSAESHRRTLSEEENDWIARNVSKEAWEIAQMLF